MNYVVFGLGLLLTAAGSASIYAGYDIIQVERGWTEVIAGTTAVSGGMITMSLGIILGRLQSLFRLYAAALPAAPVHRHDAEPLLAAAAGATRSPPATPIAASPIAVSPITASAVAPSSIASSNLFVPPAPESIAATETEPLVAAPLFPKPNLTPLSKPNFFPANSRGPLKPFNPKPIPLDETGDQISEPLAADTETEDSASTIAAIESPLPEPSVSLPPDQPRSAASLSLDEMWKRVSDEIDRPIFTARPEVTYSLAQASSASSADAPRPSLAGHSASLMASEALTAPPNLDEPHDRLHNEVADVPGGSHPDETQDHDDFGWNQSKIMNEIDSNSLERDGSEKPVSAFSYPALAEKPHFPASAEQPAQTAFDNGFGVDDHPAKRFDAVWNAGTSHHSLRTAIEQPLDFSQPVVPEPSVIGRYEAEGTAYLMFSDGSIEAQSEAGVFHFASMAELKTYIESKQAAEL